MGVTPRHFQMEARHHANEQRRRSISSFGSVLSEWFSNANLVSGLVCELGFSERGRALSYPDGPMGQST